MRTITLPSFAKINWILKVLGRRPDGFHEIRTVYQTVSLSDEITFEITAAPSIELEVEGADLGPTEDNLIVRACALARAEIGAKSGMHIRLRKLIPVGGGLGGGSSNAAITLLAANQLLSAGLSSEQMAKLGGTLGSDVPFFLTGGAAFGWGRGEQTRPVDDSPRPRLLILLYPGFSVSTRTAYQLGGWPPLPADSPLLTYQEPDNRILRFCEALSNCEDLAGCLDNDFQSPVLSHYPALSQARSLMETVGCEPVLLSGSGSTLFGIVRPDRVEDVFSSISQSTAWTVHSCRSLSRQEYLDRLDLAGLDIAQ